MTEDVKLAYTPDYVVSLEQGQVFVFGSNLLGCHAGGASQMAMNRFGAQWGQAEGPQGRCYAIPVDIKGEIINNVSQYMTKHIGRFLEYARLHPEMFFLVTRIGCGAAGFDEEFIAPFFRDALTMDNVSLPKSFVELLNGDTSDDNVSGEQNIFNLIILDESGSMSTIKKQAISGLNETFLTIRNAQLEHQELKHYISFVTFNYREIRTIMDRKPVCPDEIIEWNDYHPDSSTPLYDAMGQSLNNLMSYVNRQDVVLVTIITDGMENSSHSYSGLDIKNLVSYLKQRGWVFVYIGTNQDVDAVADDLGIKSRKRYEYSQAGVSDMFREENRRRLQFCRNIVDYGPESVKDKNYDYFEERNGEKGEEKKADIIWDLKNDNDATEEKQAPTNQKGILEKVKDYILK